MSFLVVDASVLTAFYVADDPRREVVVARLARGDALFAPAHVDAEVVSALQNVTPYDAAYVALAEQLGASVLTCDGKLATASGPRCEFELMSGPIPPRVP